jgi:hypothetical protein
MIVERHAAFWFAALLVLVAALWLLSEILLPFVAGMAIAYLLDPVVNRLVLGVLTASVFLGSSLLWSARAAPVAGDVSLVGAAGYLLSLIMGVGLLRAIWRSEHSGNSL